MASSKNILLFSILLFVKLTTAQVVINEFSAANWQQFTDNYGKPEDWIELYNTSSTPKNIGGWSLSDKVADPQKWPFPAGTTIAGHGYLVVWCSKRDEVSGGSYHTNFSLTQTKGNDYAVLASPSGAIVDSIPVRKTQTHQSWARSANGAGVWKICTSPTPGSSNLGVPLFDGFAGRPQMDLAAGFYNGPQTVTITAADSTDDIRYTLDGHEPTLASDQYTGPLTIEQTTVVKAKAFSKNPAVLPSFIQFNTYFIDEDFSLVVVSVAADDVLELANGQKDLKPVGTIEYFGQDKLRHARSYGELNSHGQDSWVNDQRSLDWVSRDEMGYSGALNEKLFGYSDRSEYQRVILRASGDDNYPGNFLPQHKGCAHIRDEYSQTLAKIGGLKLDVRSAERMVVFLNGLYWGVYGLREYPDDSDYTDYYYGQDKYHIQMLETWGNTWAQYGGDEAFNDWAQLRKFIQQNDMGNPANYQKVDDALNLTSMCDYFICGLNYVASDWINYNTAWWRGTDPNGQHKKWGYMLWDFDAVFHYYINYSGVPNTNADAQPCDIEDISNYCQNQFWGGQQNDTCQWYVGPGGDSTYYCDHVDGKHDVLFLKLQKESPQFRQLYYSRKADLENTVFTCSNMLHVLDSMAAVIDPEMTRHCQRWGGTKAKWLANVKTLRDFIASRCTKFDDGMVDCFGLTGPYPITIDVQPTGAGRVDFNTLKLKTFPWTGNYYGKMQQQIQAKPNTGFTFDHWETKAGTAVILPSEQDSIGALEIDQTDTLVAVFSPTSGTHQAENALGLRLFPSVTRTGNCTAEFSLKTAAAVEVRLVSALGQQVATMPVFGGATGRNVLRLDFSSKKLSPGAYFVEISAGPGQRAVARLMVVD